MEGSYNSLHEEPGCPRGVQLLHIVVLLLLLGACGGPDGSTPAPAEPEDTRLSVYAVNYPLTYFAERLGGDAVRVTLPVPAGVDPAHWRPAPEDILPFQQADLILLNGAGYAAWVDTAALPNNRMVDTSRSFRDRLIRIEGQATHSHGPEGEHSHGTTASHTWLDPLLALEQARAILVALITYRPENEAEFRSHFILLERDLQALDEELTTVFKALGDQPVLFSHPVYQYLARRFVPDARSLNFEPDQVPDAAALAQLRELRTDYPATLLIWEREPYAVTVEMLESEGLRSIAFVPGANRPPEGDYLDLVRWNITNLSRVLPAEPQQNSPGDGA